jgi:hypothetical protein
MFKSVSVKCRLQKLVAVGVRFVRASNWDLNVVGLLRRQFGQRHTQFRQVPTRTKKKKKRQQRVSKVMQNTVKWEGGRTSERLPRQASWAACRRRACSCLSRSRSAPTLGW